MRTPLALLLVCMLASAAAQVRRVAVPPEVKALLTPSLTTWRKLRTEQKCVALGDPQKDYPGYCSQLQDQLGAQLLALSQGQGATADEALAALFSFGVQKNQGDQDHDLICMAATRSGDMTKALSKYRACELDISGDYPKSMRSEVSSCQRAIDKAINVIRKHSANKICASD